jgi:hypothetical protein
MAAVAAAIEALLQELAQSLLTQKKDALTAFEEMFFREKPKLLEHEIKVMFPVSTLLDL